MTHFRFITVCLSITIVLATTTGKAHEGHDDAPPAPLPGAGSLPRIEAHSDLYELVGVVDKGEMTLFLDRHATNEPIIDAKIEIEAGTAKGLATANKDGTYIFKNATFAQPGQLPIVFSIADGKDNDLLTSELRVVDTNALVDRTDARLPYTRWWVTAVVLLLFGVLVWQWWSRRNRVRGTGK